MRFYVRAVARKNDEFKLKPLRISNNRRRNSTNNFCINAYFAATAARARNKPMNDHTPPHTLTNVFLNLFTTLPLLSLCALDHFNSYAAIKHSDNDRKFVNKRFNVGMFINQLFLFLYEMKWKQQQHWLEHWKYFGHTYTREVVQKNCIDYWIVQAIVLSKWAVKHLPEWKHTLTKWV